MTDLNKNFKTLYFYSFSILFLFLVSLPVNAQFVIGEDLQDTAGAAKADSNAVKPLDVDKAVKEALNKADMTDDLIAKENAVRKLQLESQRLKLEKEIESLVSKRNLTKEEQQILRVKQETLLLIAQKEKLIIENELEEFKRKASQNRYPDGTIYGQNFFRVKDFKLFSKTDEIVATDGYALGTGDVVHLEVWGARYWSKDYIVNESGAFDIPGYQRFYVKGMSLKQAREMIGSRLGLGGESSYSVTVTRPRMVNVHVFGEVFNPGTYTIAATNSIYNLLVSMGGPTNLGSVRNIYIKRDGVLKDSFDIYEYMSDVQHSRDVFLQNNDYVMVKPAERVVGIYGAVKKEGAYEVKPGEGLMKLIQFAGGLYKFAYLKNIVVSRIYNNKFETISINLDSLQKIGKDYILIGNENITIKAIAYEPQYIVEITGAVSVPGEYKVKKGMRLSDVIKTANGLTNDAYLEKAYLIRTNSDLSKKYITFVPSQVIQNPMSTEDFQIEDRDSIYIFDQKTFKSYQVLIVQGSVNRIIATKYIANMKLNEILFMAGGLKKDADSFNAIVVRYNTNFDKTIIRFNPSKVLEGGEMSDLELMPNDAVIIYNKKDKKNYYAVTASGAVKAPGQFEYMENMTVVDLINQSGGLMINAYEKRAFLWRIDPNTGYRTCKSVNLNKALKNPFGQDNIILQANDELKIYEKSNLAEDFVISINGAVKQSNSFIYSDGMTLQDAIDLSGGLTIKAAGSIIEIIRNSTIDGRNISYLKPESFTFKISNTVSLDSQQFNYPLEPFDRIFVRYNPDYVEFKEVAVYGAVVYPGKYVLQGNSERLSSVIKRAGGLRPEAYVGGSSMKRIVGSDTIDVVINLSKALSRKRSQYNYYLQSGDMILVPPSQNIVMLTGDIAQNTGKSIGVYYVKGKRAKYYIKEFGGGFSKTASKNSVVVMHQNGAMVGVNRILLLFRIYPKVRNGSTIVVKSKIDNSKDPNKFNFDVAFNKFLSRATGVLTLFTFYKIATSN